MTDTHELTRILEYNYFNVFALPTNFDVDLNALTSAYHNLQKLYHPDNTLTHENKTQALILSVSVHINNAYASLKNPLTRAILLLELNNTPLDLTHDTKLPEQFLIEQMEFHETLDAAQQADDLDSLELLEQSLQHKETSNIKQLSNAFKSKQFDIARELSKQLAFYQRVLSQINNAINTLS